MRPTVAIVLGIGAIGALVECSPFGGGDFTCEGDQSCTGGSAGRCEPSGFCSFSDPACGLDGRSWGDGPNAGQCIAGGGPVDASTPLDQTVMIDAAVLIDSAIDAAPVPYCAGTFIKVCLPSKPSTDTTLPAILDTGSSSACRNDATDMTGAPLTGFCVVAGANVTANSAVLGSKPLIVIATNKLSFNVLDVASHRGMGTGPGADFAGCAMSTGNDAMLGGGGGGGGAFGGAGGNGGNHDTNKGGAGGKKAPADKLRGGCPGGSGSTPAKFGHGGGAVMLIAAGTIEIDGILNASGSGADSAGNTKEVGGSGGGSGGMIVLEAMQITNNGFVIANGGGGASGSGSGSSPSVAGSDPNPASTTGGSGGKETTQNGGDGGDGGGTGKADGGDGIDGALFNMMTGGAGAGGGSVGAILTHGSTLSGNVSPTPTTF